MMELQPTKEKNGRVVEINYIRADCVDCAWFGRCSRPATHFVSHPVLGWVPACDRCVKVGQ